MKINLSKIKYKLKVLPGLLAKHSFVTFLGLFILSLVLSGLIFYVYVLLVEEVEIEITKNPLNFNEEGHKKVLKEWERREKLFYEASFNQFLDPFAKERPESLPLVVIPEETEEEVVEEATTTEEVIEKNVPSELTEKLLVTTNLFQFYLIRDRRVPALEERAVIWEQKGLGYRDGYTGSKYQNNILLVKLKEELTE